MKVKEKTHVLEKSHADRIKSQCFNNIHLGGNHINMARSIVLKLLQSPLNSPEGIVISADMPYHKKSLINIARPDVLRTYYGLTMKAVPPTQHERITYGSTDLSGSLSIDPRQFTTKPMSKEMYVLGQELKKYSKKQLQNLRMDTKILGNSSNFNHCTILIYNGNELGTNQNWHTIVTHKMTKR